MNRLSKRSLCGYGALWLLVEDENLRESLSLWLDDFILSFMEDSEDIENLYFQSFENMGILANLDTFSSFIFGIGFSSLQTLTELSPLSDDVKEEILYDAVLELQNRIIDFRAYYEKTHYNISFHIKSWLITKYHNQSV